MNTQEIIRQLCERDGITVSGLEKEMGYGNRALSKPGALSSERVYELAKRFNVPMEYLMTGEIERVNAETQKLERKRKILEEINELNQHIMDLYKELSTSQSRLDDLNRKYNAILIEESIPDKEE